MLHDVIKLDEVRGKLNARENVILGKNRIIVMLIENVYMMSRSCLISEWDR